MRTRCSLLAAAAVAALLIAVPAAHATVEVRLLKEIPLEEPPVATAVSADGQTIYILTGKSLLIYNANGTFRDRLPLDEPADSIALPPRGNAVILGSSVSKTLRIVSVEVVRDVAVGDSPFLGPADAPVTIVVFTDFQCPYCIQLEDVLPAVAGKYPVEVRIVYKAFPLTMHEFARKAAIAAEAADAQGKFWVMHDRLFAARGKLSDDEIAASAKDAELDLDAFNAALADPAVAARVDADFKQGESLGVRGTPTVFINGRLYGGPRSLEGFAASIDAILPKKDAK